MKNLRYIFFLILLLSVKAEAQVMISFNPALDGTSVNRLGKVIMTNRYAFDLEAKLVISVREAKQGQLLKVTMPAFTLHTGTNVLPPDVFNRSAFSFSGSQAGYALSQTRNFADGDYEYCFELNVKAIKAQTIPVDFFENCFNTTLERSTPMVLINPYDKEASCNTRPNFLWQPSMPVQPGITYILTLAEIKPQQSRAEALAYNPPIIAQNNIRTTMLNYPALAPALEQGKKYAWQVLATNAKMIVTRSDIWEYSVACETDTAKPDQDGYRELKDSRDAGSYLAHRWLRFSFYNPYGPMAVNYTISDLTLKDKELKKLPVLKMQGGFNSYELDLEDIRGLVYEHQYLLTVQLGNGKKMYLSFIYKGGNVEH
ncbi:hypothetical protein [Sediminibacterium ginsengisoli]|uniref:DUF928 domain-containing protein n=1 Tax=Sediminibacterium ginsengisoli TaxID=413434 RepID=A0A1T4PP36_9BACT|nr:hypothetical protein [Sediminibacterium ginsengisoli]SJZ93199.1 hypothetical protein SAMN04488132_106131 [Sediminibacterium ginsengisoli]